MNNKGQLILYDLLLALIIIIIVLVASTHILEENNLEQIELNKYDDASDMLELLENSNNPGLLYSLSTAQNTNDSQKEEEVTMKINEILSNYNKDFEYTLIDETANKTIVDKQKHDYREIYSSSKTVNKHRYLLKIYQ